MFVVQLRNQIELFFNQRHRVFGYAAGPALPGAVIGQLAQIGAGRQMRGHQILGVLIAKLIHAEFALIRNNHGLPEHFFRVELL